MSEVPMNLVRQKTLLNGPTANVFIGTEIQNTNLQHIVKFISCMYLHDRSVTGGQSFVLQVLWEKLQTLPEFPEIHNFGGFAQN